jgi:hypothetical protein
MIRRLATISIISALLCLPGSLVHAEAVEPMQLETSAIVSFDSLAQSVALTGQYEVSLFLDVTYLENKGIGIGFIRQDQGQDNNDDIVNNIMHYNAWFSCYPEVLPGKVSFALNYYHGSESIHGVSGSGGSGANPGPGAGPGPGSGPAPGPGPGSSKPSPATVTVTAFTDSLDIINPVLSFINYPKSLYLDIGYASSKYKASDTGVGDLTVSQWSPAVGFAFNDQYDWLQLRYYSIDLSNDTRTPGVNHTHAGSLSWSHWLKKDSNRIPDNVTVSVLTGKRLYAVDHDIRKVYNLTDMQTHSYIVGANWNIGVSSDVYIYTSYEQYKDVTNNDNYSSLFLYTGITTRW